MTESLKMTTLLPAPAERVYQAWLSSEEHGLFTGGAAEIDPCVGGAFRAWDGYIMGKTLELEPNLRILQSWRTTEFPSESPDSLLEVLLAETEPGTQITLIHTEIPDGQREEYEQGWLDYYFTPMQEYFGKNNHR